jgi:hypothetical protein
VAIFNSNSQADSVPATTMQIAVLFSTLVARLVSSCAAATEGSFLLTKTKPEQKTAVFQLRSLRSSITGGKSIPNALTLSAQKRLFARIIGK